MAELKRIGKPLNAEDQRPAGEGVLKPIGSPPIPENKQPARQRDLAAYIKDVGRAIAQGVSFGTADEIEAFVEKLRTGRPYSEAVKEIRQEIKQFKEEEPFLAYPAEIIGSIPTGLGVGGMLARRGIGAVGQAASLGSFYGAAAGEDSVGDRLKSGVIGGLTGAGIAKAIPVISEPAKKLLDRGLPMTVGQMIGGAAKTFEEAATSLPFVGSQIRGGMTRAIEGFNQAAFNEILKPLGKTIPEGAKGRAAYIAAKDAISEAYNSLVPQLKIPASADIKLSVKQMMDVVKRDLGESDYGKKAYEVFEDVVERKLISRIDDAGGISGSDLQRALSDLRSESIEYATDDVFLGKASAGMRDVADAVAEALAKNNPEHAARLKLINESFSKLIPAERAATMLGAKQGRFTPAQLLSSIRATEPSLRKQAFARGEARLQNFAESADEVIGSTLPTSGTTERLLATGLLTGGGYGVAGPTGGVAGLAFPLLGTPLAAGIYSPMGRRIAEEALKRTPLLREGAARTVAPVAAGALAPPISESLLGIGEARAEPPAPKPESWTEQTTDRLGNPITILYTQGGANAQVIRP